MGRSLDDTDPLSIVLAPPPNESSEQRALRERIEADERRVSEEIDEQLKAERAALKRRKKPVKVLLLGQSESGKSTTLKNFQLTYARKAWQEERTSWRTVIQLNLLRSITLILDLLSRELSGTNSPALPTLNLGPDDDDELLAGGVGGAGPPEPPLPRLNFTEKHKLLKLRLAPLRRVQKDLEIRIGAGSEEPTSMVGAGGAMTVAAPFEYSYQHYPSTPNTNGNGEAYYNSASAPLARRPQEFFVRSSTGWKSALEKIRPRNSTSSRDGVRERWEREAEEATQVIAGCRDDMRMLWEDGVVREMLDRRKIRLEESGGFFLNDLDRVAAPDYEPSDDDVIRARLRTMGVQEYRFLFERGAEVGHEWLMYDVGGTRTLRQAWSPFFDDMNAIIFLAPISCFDEKLAEDRRVNRLEDSFLLWKAVCANKLLAKTQLILFLNKCDLLEKKLKAGVMVKGYVPSFGERSNTTGTVAKYLRQKFRDLSKQYSPEPRPFYVHLTSVIDTKATAITLGAVREGILRDHLRGADFI